jgi:hypothetical protein
MTKKDAGGPMDKRRFFLSRDAKTWVEVTAEDWMRHGSDGYAAWMGFGTPSGKVIELVPMPEVPVRMVPFAETWEQLQETLGEIQSAVDRDDPYSADTVDVNALMERLVLSWPPSPADVGEAAGYLMMLVAERNHLRGLISSESN